MILTHLIDTAFQSTPPARGATIGYAEEQSPTLFQSTPPARGATIIRRRSRSRRGFQSTPPARGATPDTVRAWFPSWHFNPRPPRGGRRYDNSQQRDSCGISIHAPREGGDWQSAETPDSINIFQSTPPARGATKIRFHTIQRDFDFNPRPPRGGRPCITHPFCFKYAFQSTPPARGATTFDIQVDDITGISIHAPREGGDSGK